TPTHLIAALDELVRTDFASAEPAGPKPREVRVFRGHSGPVWCVAVSDDGRFVVSSGQDKTIRIWNLATGDVTYSFGKQSQEVRGVALWGWGDRLAGACGISVRLFDSYGRELQRFSGHSAAVRCIAFSPDDRWLFTGGDDKSLRVWDLTSGRETQRFVRHTG